MNRVLTAVVACAIQVAPSQASSGGWGAAGSTTGAGGAWPHVPLSAPPTDQAASNERRPLNDANTPPVGSYGGADAADGNGNNYYNNNVPPPAEGYARQGGDGAAAGGAAGYYDPSGDHHNQQQQQQQQQQQPYDPSYVPQQTRWAGQQYNVPPDQRQYQEPQQQQQQQHVYGQQGNLPQQQGPPDDAMRLGTKWRSIVSRVKDVVRPGQPMPYEQKRYGDSGAGGGYPPSASPWAGAGGANQHAGYTTPSGSYGQHAQAQQVEAYESYGHEQSHPPASAGYDPLAAATAQQENSGYSAQENDAVYYANEVQQQQQQQQQQHASASFDSRGLPYSPPPHQGDSGAGAWQSPPPSTESAGQHEDSPEFFAAGGGGDGGCEAASQGGDDHGGGGGGGGGGYPGMGSGISGAAGTARERQGRMEEGGSPPQMQPHGGHAAGSETQQYAPPMTEVGQGWSAVGVGPASTPPQQQAQQRQGEHGAGGDQARASTAPGVDAAACDAPQTAWIPPGEHNGQSDGSVDGGLSVSGPPGETGTPSSRRPTMAREDSRDLGAVISNGDQREAVAAAAAAAARPLSSADVSGGHKNSPQQHTPTAVPLDTMPSSADHGLAKVDWGKGAEEEEEGGGGVEEESGETVAVIDGQEGLEREREEEALIRELERMDGIGDAEGLLDSGRVMGGRPPLQSDQQQQQQQQQAMIDEAVEHRLDVLFDSILDDDVDGLGLGLVDDDDDDDDCLPAAATPDTDYEVVDSAAASPSSPAITTSDATAFSAETDGKQRSESWSAPSAEWTASSAGGGDSARADGYPAQPFAGESFGNDDDVNGAAAIAWSTDPAGAEEESTVIWGKPAVAAAAAAPSSTASASPEVETPESMWGKTGRWASLPTHAVVLSEPEESVEEQEEEEEEEEGADEDAEEYEVNTSVPLDPIELPPSAATDEIWNDQHLQDQLDAYWEQSQRGGAFTAGAGVGTGAGVAGVGATAVSPLGGQQLSTYGGLQPTYGPGDWVGKGAAMVQEPLPGAVDGVGRAGWVAPRLFPGSQAPINIYGNIHVHLRGSQDDGEQQPSAPSSPELSARERYYSQGETSWSGSERGGQ